MSYLTYKSFHDKESVDLLIKNLQEHNVEFEIVEDRESLDSLYGNKPFTNYFFVKLKQEDFQTADAILLKESEREIEIADTDHYLYGFSDDELFEILTKPDEWSVFDYQLSKKLLKERGREINADTIELLKKHRLHELAKPEEDHRNWIYAGYLFSMLGGIIGVFIGWHLSTFKKTLPNGQQVYGHNLNDRKHGRRIFVIGTIMFLISMAIKFSKSSY